MNKLLIADAGSTKIRWALDNRIIATTQGVNPVIASDDELKAAFDAARQLTAGLTVNAIRYYGAGCLPHICPKVASILGSVFATSDVEVNSDLLGAARAIHFNRPGIACIMGTGAVAGLYDGTTMAYTAPALGFILGDEGSGAALGKRLAGDLFKGALPAALRDKFTSDTGLDMAGIISHVYRGEAPNRFLGSLAPWIHANIGNDSLRDMVVDEMTRFLQRNVMQIPGYSRYPIGFIGSVAENFRSQLLQAASTVDLHISNIIADPMERLIKYHLL